MSDWFRAAKADLRPWLQGGFRWEVVLGEVLLGRESPETVRSLWPHIREWRDPRSLIDNHGVVLEIARWIGRESEAEHLLELSRAVGDPQQDGIAFHDDDLMELRDRGLIPRTVAELAMVVDSEGEEPVIATAGALRVAGRFLLGNDRWLVNRNSDGRIAVGRLVGYDDDNRDAHLGLIELGRLICTPKQPDCAACPLAAWCKWAAD